MSAFVDFELTNAEDNASSEFVEFSEERVDLSNFIVVFDVVLEGVFQLRFFVLFLQLNIHFEPFNDASLLLFELLLFVRIFGDCW
jgi:hypothetical protein